MAKPADKSIPVDEEYDYEYYEDAAPAKKPAASKPPAKAPAAKGAAPPAKAPAKAPAKVGAKPSAKQPAKAQSTPDDYYYEDEDPVVPSRPVGPGGARPAPVSQAPAPSTQKAQSASTPIAVPAKQPAVPTRIPAPVGRANVGDEDFVAAPTAELAKIFQLITKFQPAQLDLQPHFKGFLPELRPAIGQPDMFVKIPRPDHVPDMLGLTVLDEPTIGQTNPQILRMQLREKYGVVGGNESDGYIGVIDHGADVQKSLSSFIESYDTISRGRGAPSMVYSGKMPEIQDLMEPWADELREALEATKLPGADIDMSLEDYARFVCAMFDIPVRGNIVESLHVLFSLYQRFKEISYFQQERP